MSKGIINSTNENGYFYTVIDINPKTVVSLDSLPTVPVAVPVVEQLFPFSQALTFQ